VRENHRHRLYMSLSQCGNRNGQIFVCCTNSPYPLEALRTESEQLNSIIDHLSNIEPTVDVGKGRDYINYQYFTSNLKDVRQY
jgi:hypothetical protein